MAWRCGSLARSLFSAARTIPGRSSTSLLHRPSSPCLRSHLLHPRRPLVTVPRTMGILGCTHSADAASRLTSHISVESRACCELSQASRARDYSSDGLDVSTNANRMDPVKSFSGQSIGGQDVQTSMELSFLEAVQGCTKTVTFLTDVLCNTCGGSGVRSGTGPKTSEHRKGSGGVSFCKSCKGAKVIKGTESVKFDIIPGVDDGETIKVFKRGGADPDGDRPGHLYVAIKVRKDPVFWRDGYDIHVKTVISSTRALYGGPTYVPTLTGDAGVKVPRGTQHGDVLVLEEKGEQVDIICVIRDTIQGKHGGSRTNIIGILGICTFILSSNPVKPDIEEFAKEAAGV